MKISAGDLTREKQKKKKKREEDETGEANRTKRWTRTEKRTEKNGEEGRERERGRDEDAEDKERRGIGKRRVCHALILPLRSGQEAAKQKSLLKKWVCPKSQCPGLRRL